MAVLFTVLMFIQYLYNYTKSNKSMLPYVPWPHLPIEFGSSRHKILHCEVTAEWTSTLYLIQTYQVTMLQQITSDFLIPGKLDQFIISIFVKNFFLSLYYYRTDHKEWSGYSRSHSQRLVWGTLKEKNKVKQETRMHGVRWPFWGPF